MKIKNDINNKEDGYLKEMKKIWKIKETIYEETKNMNYNQYVSYVDKNISDIKARFKDRYIKFHQTV